MRQAVTAVRMHSLPFDAVIALLWSTPFHQHGFIVVFIGTFDVHFPGHCEQSQVVTSSTSNGHFEPPMISQMPLCAKLGKNASDVEGNVEGNGTTKDQVHMFCLHK